MAGPPAPGAALRRPKRRSGGWLSRLGALGTITICIYIVGYIGCFPVAANVPLRFLLYLIPPVWMAFVLSAPGPKFEPVPVLFLLCYWMICLPSLVEGVNERTLINIGIISAFIAGFVPRFKVDSAVLKVLLAASVIMLAINVLVEGSGITFKINIFESASITGGYDNSDALVGALYAVYFFCTKSVPGFFFGLILTVLGGKRIALVAALAGVLTYYFVAKTPLARSLGARFAFLLVVLGFVNVAAVDLLAFVDLLGNQFGLTFNGEVFFAGRLGTNTLIYDSLRERTFYQFLFGNGPGACDTLVLLSSGGQVVPTHNDWMRFYYDYGLVGSALLTVGLAALYALSPMTVALGCALGILMITDNVVLYIFIQLLAALMFASERAGLRREPHHRHRAIGPHEQS